MATDPRARHNGVDARGVSHLLSSVEQKVENSILYTFSTIAQALGGAFALLSTFVLYRFQSLSASMQNSSTSVRAIWTSPADVESFDILRGLSKWRLLNQAIDAQIARHPSALNHAFDVAVSVARLHAGERLERFLKWAFWLAVALTFLVMSASVAIIPYAHEIAEARTARFVHMLTVSGVVAFSICLASYLLVIRAALVSNYGNTIVQQHSRSLLKNSS
jgi:hypothetical protein